MEIEVRQSNLVPETTSYPEPLLRMLESALHAAYDRETCYPAERSDWTPDLPSYGQCAVAALVVQSYLGGEIIYDHKNIHFWNRVEGHDIDMSRDQFAEWVEIKPTRIRTREELLHGPRAEAAETLERYLTLRSRVSQMLGEFEVFSRSNEPQFESDYELGGVLRYHLK